MKLSAVDPPATDPTPIFELYRGNLATELLTAAVAHFNIFGRLAAGPRTVESLREELGLAERPAVVLFTALRAMGLLHLAGQDRLDRTPLAREHLEPGCTFDVGGYVGLSAESPGPSSWSSGSGPTGPPGPTPRTREPRSSSVKGSSRRWSAAHRRGT